MQNKGDLKSEGFAKNIQLSEYQTGWSVAAIQFYMHFLVLYLTVIDQHDTVGSFKTFYKLYTTPYIQLRIFNTMPIAIISI